MLLLEVDVVEDNNVVVVMALLCPLVNIYAFSLASFTLVDCV